MKPALGVALGKLLADLVTLNWTAATKSGLDVIGQVRRRNDAIVARAIRRASDQLEAWRLPEHVSIDDCLEGIGLAERAVGAMSPEKYADIAREHRGKPELVARAIVEDNGLRHDAVVSVATHVLRIALMALTALPGFAEQVDRAVMWATAESVAAEERGRRESAHDSEAAGRIRAHQFEEALRRHTVTRLAALASQHETRQLHETSGTRLGSEVTRVDSWRTSLSRERTELCRALTDANRRSRIATQIDGIDLRGRYDAAHAELRQAAHLFRQNPSVAALPQTARNALARLRREANEPRYRTGVLLTGRWGAGKSRVLAEIAAEVTSDSGVQVLLRPLPGEGRLLDEALLNEAQLATGRSYGSLLEFRNDLKERSARAVVFVDDVVRFLPTRLELDRFTQWMLDLTDDDRFRWVLAVDSWQLDRVLSPESTPRWNRISAFPRNAETVSAWIDLDSSERIGEALIRRELGVRPDTTESMAALLRVPLNAWLFVDVVRAGMALPQALTDFDETYWNEAVDSLTSTRNERRACRVVRLVLEQLFFDSFGRPVSVDDVHDRVAGLSEDAVDVALDVLGEARLITFTSDDAISIESAPLWAKGLAQKLVLSEQASTTKRDLSELESRVLSFDGDVGEVLVAQILDQTSNAPAQLTRLIQTFLGGVSTLETGIWVAALNSIDVRTAVFAALRGRPTRTNALSAHGTYLLLRLIELGQDELSFIDGLKSVEPSYETIGENGLQVVFHRFIRRLSAADVQTERARHELLRTASRIHGARAGWQFAVQWVTVSAEMTSPDHLLTEVERFIRGGAKYSRQEVAVSSAGDVGRPDTAPFVLHLIDAVVPYLVSRIGTEYAYDLLVGRGWLDEDGWQEGLGGELRRASHVALGKSYAESASAVIALLGRLCRGDRSEQESAVFVLRHTAPTFGRRGVHLSDELKPFALQLNESKRLDRDLKTRWVKPMLSPSDD